MVFLGRHRCERSPTAITCVNMQAPDQQVAASLFGIAENSADSFLVTDFAQLIQRRCLDKLDADDSTALP
jgi:hypothetical protein